MKTIGITGYTGYVGGVLSTKLSADKNLTVKYFDQNAHSLLDPTTLTDFVRDCDTILHLASIIRSNDPAVMNVNVMGTANLLSTIAQINQNCHFIFASSFDVYKPSNVKELIDEAYEKTPRSLYGLSKLMAEEVVSFYAIEKNIKSTVLRLTNIFGPSPNKSSSIVALILDRIEHDTELTIHSDGSQTRDYVYIDDVANAFLSAITTKQKENLRMINICSGVEVSIIDLVHKIEKLVDKKAKIKFDPAVDGGGYRCGNNMFAKNVLNWSPSVTFDKGLERLVKSL